MYDISSVIVLRKSEISDKRAKPAAKRLHVQLAQSEGIGNWVLKTENARKAISETPCLPASFVCLRSSSRFFLAFRPLAFVARRAG